MSRLVFALVVMFAAAGCPQSAREDAANLPGDDQDDPAPGTKASCGDDSDCELAGRTCCECKTIALSMADPKLDACDSVSCPPPQNMMCPKVRAACVENKCTVACIPVAATMSCANGFAADSAGCLVDVCAQAKNECTINSDCTRTRADCCGCARGGNDRAVAIAAQSNFDKALGCTGSEVCPDVTTCNPDESAQCAQGECRLIEGGLPAGACGRPDLPACGTGFVCVVNASDSANLHGVGVCTPTL